MADLIRTNDDGEVLTFGDGSHTVAIVGNAASDVVYFTCFEDGEQKHAGIVKDSIGIECLMRFALGEDLDETGLVLG